MRKFIEVNAFAFFAFILFLVVDIYADSTCKILGRIQIDSVLEAKPICTSGLRINDISQYLVAKMVGVEKVNADLYLEKKRQRVIRKLPQA